MYTDSAQGILRVTVPLVTRKFIEQLTLASTYHNVTSHDGLPAPKSIGYGIGLGFALVSMQYLGSMLMIQGYQRSQVMGLQLRAAVSLNCAQETVN